MFPNMAPWTEWDKFFPFVESFPLSTQLVPLIHKIRWNILGKGEEFQLYRSLMLERMSLMTSLVSGSVLHCFSTRSMEWRMVV